MGSGNALREGYIVGDRFQLLRILGRGGMGNVWVARHLALHIDVAIKFIDDSLAAREDLRSRFAQEARTAARIQSPHVVNILDYGFDGTQPFIVMELLQGESLGARLERETSLPPGDVAAIVAQAAKGLARAHALGIVHRDLKPDNLFLCRDEDGTLHVKLLDFGIARDDTPFGAASHRTGTGQLLGTPAYMSPEQAVARTAIDFRSDLYSLAVVAYHCLTGRLPFVTESVGDLIVSLTTINPPPPSSLVPVPPAIDSWFRCAFQREPAARFSSAKEMADTFAMAWRESSAAYDATVLAPAGPPTVPGSSVPSAPMPERTRFMSPVMTPGAPIQPVPRSVAPPVKPAARAPDTFNGQYATQGADPPGRPRRGPSPVVIALVALIIVTGIAGSRIYVSRPPAPAATSASLAAPPVVPPSVSIAPPAASSAAAAPLPPSDATTSAPVATVPPTPSPAPSARRSPAPKPSPAPSPTHAPKPAPTNDYGL